MVFFGEKALKLDIRDKTLLNNKLTSYIKKLKPEIVLTHHWSDINKDHNIVFDCVTVATRPINNQNIMIETILFMLWYSLTLILT